MAEKSIKNKMKSKHRAYHKFLSRGSKPEEKEHINRVRNETNRLIVNGKDDYFYNLGKKFSDPPPPLRSKIILDGSE